MTHKQAIYPGSFDPITNGHIDVINRSLRIFDSVCIGIIENPAKKPLFSIEQRLEHIRELFPNRDLVQVEGFKGLLADFSRKKGIPTIIRGLRAVSDFDYEFQMAITNQKLNSDLETVFLMTDVKYSYLSSSIVKQVAQYDGDVSDFVPRSIKKALEERLA